MLLSCIQYCSIYPFKRIFLSNCRCRWLLWFIFSLSRAWMQQLRRSQDNGARYTGHMLSSLVAARQDMTCKLGTTSTSSTPVERDSRFGLVFISTSPIEMHATKWLEQLDPRNARRGTCVGPSHLYARSRSSLSTCD